MRYINSRFTYLLTYMRHCKTSQAVIALCYLLITVTSQQQVHQSWLHRIDKLKLQLLRKLTNRPGFPGQSRFGTLCPHNQLHCFVWPLLITIYCL